MSVRAARGPVLAVLAVVVGTRLGEWRGPGPSVGPLCAGAAVLIGALACAPRRRAAVAVLGFTLLGGASMQRALDGLVHSPVASLASGDELVVARVTLADDPGGGRYSTEVLARVASIDAPDGRRLPVRRTLLLTASGSVGSELRLLESGDRLVVHGRVSALADRYLRWQWKHAVARLAVDDVVVFIRPRDPLSRVANAARGLVLSGQRSLPPVERALMSGFLLGDTRQVPDDVIVAFRESGLSHLLAVSGANVAFVLVLVQPVLRRGGLSTRFAGGVVTLVVFGAMTRWEPSVMRAIAMTGCALLAALVGRPQAAARVLALAVLALVLIDPFLVHSVGFALSVGATAGIALAGPPVAARLRGPAWLRAALGTTLAAQLGVAPVLLPVFGTVPLVSLPANLLAEPLVGPLTIWGLVSGVAGGVLRQWWPGASRILQVPTGVLVRAVAGIAGAAARMPLNVDGRGAWGLGALACMLGALARLRRLRA